MAYYWELRRIFRQKLRSLTPKQTLSYQQWSRRRLMISFVLFFVGWKAAGLALNDFLLWQVDEETGVGRMLTPAEGKARRATAIAAAAEADRRHLAPIDVPPAGKKFILDD